MKSIPSSTIKTTRTIAKILSVLFIGFALIMFIGSSMESSKNTNPETMSMYSIVQLALMGIGLLGLVLAWKWEMAGGIFSLLAFITVFIVNPDALLWTMLIFPANAILFIIAAYLSKKSKIDPAQ